MNWLTSVPDKTENYLSRKMDDDAIVFPRETGSDPTTTVYTLNATAARIWELIDGQRSGSDILAALREEYDASESQLENDLTTLLSRLSDVGALSPRPNP